MKNYELAMCGCRCYLCKAYTPNVQKSDQRKELAIMWHKYYGLDPAVMDSCDGCRNHPSDEDCPVRKCVLEKGLRHCGDCGDFPCGVFYKRCGSFPEKKKKFDMDEYNEYMLAYDNETRLKEYQLNQKLRCTMNIKTYLSGIAAQNGLDAESLQFPDCELDPASIKAIMINEVVPKNPDDWFYSETQDPENRRTAFGIFETAGLLVKRMRDVLDLGIYITAAVKSPKDGYTVEPAVIRAQLPILEAELALFPNLRVIMLMGDVAKKTVNMIAKARTKKNIIPSQPTGRIRGNEYHWDGLRVFPSYIMTGKNLRIEPGKCGTIAEDIRRMMDVIK